MITDLDQMPLVTNNVFGLVFRHLKVSSFVLNSEKPLKSVSTFISSNLNFIFHLGVKYG